MTDEVLYDGTSGDPTVVWYDPGGTTGWTVISVHPDALLDPEVRVLDNVTAFSCGEFYGNEFMQVDAMIALAEAWLGAVLGTERWVLYRSSHGRQDENLTVLERLNAAFRYGLHLRALGGKVDARGKPLVGLPELLGPDGVAVRREIPRVYRQNAKLALETFTDDRLAKIRLPVEVSGEGMRKDGAVYGKTYADMTRGKPHARDAVRHALTFLQRMKSKPPLRAEAFPALTSG